MAKPLPLRLRLTLVLLAVNVAVLGGLALWAAQESHRQKTARDVELLSWAKAHLQNFEPERIEDVADILAWPLWAEFEDAVVIDRRSLNLDGETVPVGAFLNPVGRRSRPSNFPMAEVLQRTAEVAEVGETISLASGLAFPLRSSQGLEGEAWGSAWVRPRLRTPAWPLFLRILLTAAAATGMTALLLYFAVGRAVLLPIESLASGARRLGRDLQGGPGAAIALPVAQGGSSAEVEDLRLALDDMAARIQGFRQELEHEVEQATGRAVAAERRAARQDRLAALGTLAAGLAHEMNSPLAGATQGLDVLRQEAKSERGERWVGMVGDALARMGHLLQRLLHLTPTHVEATECSLQEALGDLPEFLASRLQKHRFEMDLGSEKLKVRGSVGDLFPVFLNLLTNALDAVDGVKPNGGVIRLRAWAVSRGVQIQLEDDGPGAPVKLLSHLFEPFVTGKDVGQGSGLGLALAHTTIRQLGGEIELANRENGGFRVMILLPTP